MKSGWVDRDAEAIVADGAKAGIGRDLALRVYTTRLLGRDPKLVLHGGGNTSLKAKMRDRGGAEVEVLRVKASGVDMATIAPDGLPAVRLEPMRKLRVLDAIDDEELLGIERANLIDPRAPNPSVEMMLHAFLPHKFVDHTHATAVLSLIDQPRGEQICGEVFDGRMAFVPYLMPGFGLAKKAIEVFEGAPGCEGLILSKHGLVTFGETAREAYERMIAFVSRAEDFIARNRKSVAAAPSPIKTAPVARSRADRARGVQRARRKHRGRVAAARARISQRRCRCGFRQWQGFAALERGRRDHAGPHHSHQELAARPRRAANRKARRFRASRTPQRASILNALPGLFRTPQ